MYFLSILLLLGFAAFIAADLSLTLDVFSSSGEKRQSITLKDLQSTTKPIELTSSTDELKLHLKSSSYPTALVVLSQKSTLRSWTFELDAAGKLELSASRDLKLNPVFQSPGVYDLKVYLGGAAVDQPATWSIGSVDFKFKPQLRLQPTRLDQRESEFLPLPNIQHVFRASEKMPPVTVSLVFTGLTLAPWLFLIPAWLKMGVNIKRFPWSSLAFIPATLFLGLLGAFIGVFYLYWVKLNIFQTLLLLLPLGMVTAYVGKKVLSNLARQH